MPPSAAGLPEDFEALITSHIPLARALARRFQGRGEALEDLEQVAYLGLVLAARRFDASRGAAFSTYAQVTILGELKKHFRDRAWAMRVPRSVKETYLRVKEAGDRLTQQNGSSPTISRLATSLGISEEQVLEAVEAGSNFWTDSLDRHGFGYEGSAVAEPGRVEDQLDAMALASQLARLGRTERYILRQIYVEGHTQQEVAEELGTNQMRVSRLHARTIRELRIRLAGPA